MVRDREIEVELQKVYEEMATWDGAKGPFTDQAIRRTELILLKQQILYQVIDARTQGNKVKENFAIELLQKLNQLITGCFQSEFEA